MMDEGFEAFYSKNVGLARKIARKVFARLLAMGAAVEYQDVEQEASIIMMRAYEKFDPNLGFQFSTYYYRAAYNELQKFVKSYEQDRQVLGVFSITGARGDDGEEIDLESTIDGGHGSPEQYLESKQLLEGIEEDLSPLAFKLLELIVEPPEELVREWAVAREIEPGGRQEMTMGFVTDYVRKMGGFTSSELRSAATEVGALGRRLNE